MHMEKEKAIKIASITIGLIITGLLIWFGLRIIERSRASTIVGDVKIDASSNAYTVTYTVSGSICHTMYYGSEPDITNLKLVLPATSQKDLGNGMMECIHDNTLVPTGITYFYLKSTSGDNITNAGVPYQVSVGEIGGAVSSPTSTPSAVLDTPTSTPIVSTPIPTITTTAITPTTADICTQIREKYSTWSVDCLNEFTAFDCARCLKTEESEE